MTAVRRPFRAAGLVAAALLVGTCSTPPSVIEQVREGGVLRIVTRNSPTAYYLGVDGPEGPEFELASGFARWLGVEVSFSLAASGADALEAVVHNRAHLAAAGIVASADRRGLVALGPAYRRHRPARGVPAAPCCPAVRRRPRRPAHRGDRRLDARPGDGDARCSDPGARVPRGRGRGPARPDGAGLQRGHRLHGGGLDRVLHRPALSPRPGHGIRSRGIAADRLGLRPAGRLARAAGRALLRPGQPGRHARRDPRALRCGDHAFRLPRLRELRAHRAGAAAGTAAVVRAGWRARAASTGGCWQPSATRNRSSNPGPPRGPACAG